MYKNHSIGIDPMAKYEVRAFISMSVPKKKKITETATEILRYLFSIEARAEQKSKVECTLFGRK